jgi:MoxR-like ATPase
MRTNNQGGSQALELEKGRLDAASSLIRRAREAMAVRIVGKEDLVDALLTGLIARGHVLLEGVPGLAKTLAVRTLAQISSLSFSRIQFTPDLLPADIIGTLIYNQQTGAFSARKGPVFAQVLLADEINRAPAKVQSALLEAMEEGQVTIGETSYRLPEPFFVLATQNPIEHEGTYALPEAELDRFLLKALVGYPSEAEEADIVADSDSRPGLPVPSVLSAADIASLRQAAESVRVDEAILRYLTSIVRASRPEKGKKKNAARESLDRFIEFGASPRASLALYRCARVRALLEGRPFVLPDDVKAAAPSVLRHRIVLSYEAEAEGLCQDEIVRMILSLVPQP